jgi:hypothetical protein
LITNQKNKRKGKGRNKMSQPDTGHNSDHNTSISNTTNPESQPQSRSLIPLSLLHKISLKAENLATHSWEHGTVFHALLQLYDPDLSIFSDTFDLNVPVKEEGGGSNLGAAAGGGTSDDDGVRALKYIKPFINTSADKCEELFYEPNGGAGDPASLGIAALMIGFGFGYAETGIGRIGQALQVTEDDVYVRAVERQVEFLLTKVPRWKGDEEFEGKEPGLRGYGAISHRKNVAELWADFVFMAPPFLAFAGAIKRDITLAREAVKQITAYREVLLHRSALIKAGGKEEDGYGQGQDTAKAWMHIIGPENQDLGFWSTSNGWAALGIASVIAILQKWPGDSGVNNPAVIAEDMSTLTSLAGELIDGVICLDRAVNALPKQDTTSWDPKDEVLLRNYIDDQSWFPEVAGTAAIAAAIYRMAALGRSLHFASYDPLGRQYLEWAEEKYRAIALNYIDHETGLVTPVVNALNHLDRTALSSGTAEAQCFVLMMEAARRGFYTFEEE